MLALSSEQWNSVGSQRGKRRHIEDKLVMLPDVVNYGTITGTHASVWQCGQRIVLQLWWCHLLWDYVYHVYLPGNALQLNCYPPNAINIFFFSFFFLSLAPYFKRIDSSRNLIISSNEFRGNHQYESNWQRQHSVLLLSVNITCSPTVRCSKSIILLYWQAYLF